MVSAAMGHANTLSSFPLWSQATNRMIEAAYARGLAEGMTYAKGFANGAESVAASNVPRQLGQIDKHGKDENCRPPHGAEQSPMCKWYQQGTCKFGAGCRYFH